MTPTDPHARSVLGPLYERRVIARPDAGAVTSANREER